MNPNKAFNPTPEENRAAIDALKAETLPALNTLFYDARSGFHEGQYVVIAKTTWDNEEVFVGKFNCEPMADGQFAGRIVAESLARQINSASVGK